MSNPDFWAKAEPDHLYDRWPKQEDGTPVQPAKLIHTDNLNMQDELIVNMLEAYGIPCLRTFPGDGSFGKLVLGISGQGVDILVPETLLQDAEVLIQGVGEEDA